MSKTYTIFIELNEREYIADSIKTTNIDMAVQAFKWVYQLRLSNNKIKEYITEDSIDYEKNNPK